MDDQNLNSKVTELGGGGAWVYSIGIIMGIVGLEERWKNVRTRSVIVLVTVA